MVAIFTMLRKFSLGHYRYEISMLFWDIMMYFSKLVSGSEIWINVTNQDYNKLEDIEEMFLRRLLNVSMSTPKEGRYIEAGEIKINFLLKIR